MHFFTTILAIITEFFLKEKKNYAEKTDFASASPPPSPQNANNLLQRAALTNLDFHTIASKRINFSYILKI